MADTNPAGSILDKPGTQARPEAADEARQGARGETKGRPARTYDDFTRQAGAAKAP